MPSCSNPWDGVCRPMLIPSKVLANERPTLPSYLDGLLPEVLNSYTDLIKKCWVENPSERPSSLVIVCELQSIGTRISSPTITDPKVSSNSVAEDVKFRFLENTDDVQYHILNLSIHQGSVMENVGDITASCAREGTEFDSDLTADISAHAQMLDGTNACVFSSIAITEWFRKNEKKTQLPFNKNILQKAVEGPDIILSVPELRNDVRDPSSRYTVEEALQILSRKGIFGRNLLPEQAMASTSGITTTQGKESLRQGLNVLHQRRPAQAVFTCPPYSFFIGSGINPDSTANFTIIDTHCVPKSVGGNENAAVVQINPTSVGKAASHLAKWIEMRLESSGVGNVQNCMDILLDPSNSEIGPELTDTYLCLEDEEENESLCNALEDSLREMETGVTNMEIDCERVDPCDNQKIEEDTKDVSEEGEPWSCPSEMAAPAKTTETLWTGYLARFGHSSLKQFQKHAIQAVELCRDSIII